MSEGAHLYKQANQATSSLVERIIELYDESVLKLEDALLAIHENRYEDRYLATERVRMIFNAFLHALDDSTEDRKEVAANLEAFYNMVLDRLIYINVHNDPGACQAILESVSKMRDSWRQANQFHKEKNVSPSVRNDDPTQSGIEISV